MPENRHAKRLRLAWAGVVFVLLARVAAAGSTPARIAGPDALLARAGGGDAKAAQATPDPVVEAGSTAREKPPEAVVKALYADDGVRTTRRMPLNVVGGLLGIWNRDNAVPALIGMVTAASASYLDTSVQHSLSSPDAGFGAFAETGGGPIVSTTAVVGLFAWGRFDHRHPRWRATTYDMMDAALVNLVYTEAAKRLVRRERPNGQDRQSFPSGHTSNAFALATCFERHYGWRVSVPAYLIASAVGGSRLQRNKHYLSDVAAGAAIGYVVGRTVARVNGRPLHPEEKRGPTIGLTPIVGRRTGGIVMSVVF